MALFALCPVLVPSTAAALQPDKVLHVKAGGGIAAAVVAAMDDPLLGAAMACAAGGAKEIYDTSGRGTPEMADMLYTCVAGSLSSYYLHGANLGLYNDALVIDISFKW